MDSKVFREQMERLMSCFGERNYNTDRCALIWKECSNLSNEWMIRTVDHFIGNERHAPLMPEFRSEIAKEREHNWKAQKNDKWVLPPNLSDYLCSDCDNKGIVNVDQEGNVLTMGVGYIFKCHCKYGSQRTEKWPQLLRRGLKSVGKG